MKLAFVHGWGFDSSVFDGLRVNFPGCRVLERGYFGASTGALPDEDFVAVTHSFGTMRLLAALPSTCRGIVAINGFDRFCAGPDFPGVPLRIIDRMIARFSDAPRQVVAEFRNRCGCDEPFGSMDEERLRTDLAALRDGDCRKHVARSGLPFLSLQGGRDPILPPEMRCAVFAQAGRCERITLENSGHLLPLQEPATCAEAISAFMERLP